MRRSLRDLLDWHSTHQSVTSKFKVVELKQITFEALKQSAKDTRYKRWNTIHRIHNIRWKIKPLNNHIQNVPHCSSTRKIDVWLYGLKLRSHYALTWAVEERKRAYCAFALLIRLTGRSQNAQLLFCRHFPSTCWTLTQMSPESVIWVSTPF